MLAFFIASALLGFFVSYIWSSKGIANVCFKMLFSAYTVWAVLVLAAYLLPLLSSQIRLL